MAETEDVFGSPARIGVVLLDGERSFVVKKAVKNMECSVANFASGGGVTCSG